MFKCDMCGACCRNVRNYPDLPSTDGVCDYLVDNKCSIYDTRPLVCRVDALHKKLKMKISLKEWHRQNEEACKVLKEACKGSAQP